MLQVDDALVGALDFLDFEIAADTNGTIVPPTGIHRRCDSPKPTGQFAVSSGNELGLVYPQTNAKHTDSRT